MVNEDKIFHKQIAFTGMGYVLKRMSLCTLEIPKDEIRSKKH